ncbi:MAG: peptidoglycan editing factor PgeF [bacterium]
MRPNIIPTDDQFIFHEPWRQQYPWLIQGVTTRRFGANGDPKHIDLRRLQDHLNVHHVPLIFCEQVHGSRVAVVDDLKKFPLGEGQFHQIPETDALVLAMNNVMVQIFTADCPPIFLLDSRLRRGALAHAGWRGTFDEITVRTIEAMTQLGSNVRDLSCWIGPGIKECCFEVGEDLLDRFKSKFPDCAQTNGGRTVDLVAINVSQACRAGIAPDNIAVAPFCTQCDSDEFFSYRADNGKTGRNISVLLFLDDHAVNS